MNLKQFGFGVATAVAMTTGAVLVESPAQAMLAGKLVVNLNNEVIDVTSAGVDFSNTVNNTGIAVANTSTGSFVGTTVKIKDLAPISPFVEIPNFLTLSSGETFKLTELINPSYQEFFGANGGPLVQKVFQASLKGIFSTGQSGSTPIDSVLAFKFVSGGVGGGSIEITPIPTPALLPGLIGMGVAAIRKKRKDEESEATPESAEARA